jgi:hypothetical protein
MDRSEEPYVSIWKTSHRIEVRVPADEYQRQFQKFEQPVMLGDGVGTQLAIPAEFLDALNIVSTRLAHRTAGQPNGT